MQKFKKPVSILLAILMVFSVFAIVPVTAGAAEDTYTVAGSSKAIFGHEWNETDTANDMTLVDGVYTITYTDVQPANDIELKVVKNHNWDNAYPYSNYVFSVETVSDVTVTFDPATETVNVTGDGVTQDFDVYSVIAVGNGEDGDAYLNGADWDPCDQSNALTQVSDGIWEMTMEDIYAWDLYNIKFVVNSVDADGNPTSNPWAYNFGAEVEQLYPTGEELDAVYNGKSCIFEVEEDGSTVKLQLDLRNFDFDTKRGAKMTITVTAPEPEPTTEKPSTEEPTTEEPTTAEPEPEVEIASTFLLTDNLGWGVAYVCAWDANGDPINGEWPGKQITETETNDDNQTQFVVEVPEGAVGVVVSNGNGAQTEDITDFSYDGYWMDGTKDDLGQYIVTGYNEDETETTEATKPEVEIASTFLLTDNFNWGVAYVYAWDANGDSINGEWPGAVQSETVVNDYGETKFICLIPEGAVGVIINNGNGAQTEDITDFSYDGYWMDGTKDDLGQYIVTGYNVEEPTTEPAPVVNDIYTVAGSSAAMFGTTWDATKTANDLTLGDGGVYSITYTDVQPENAIQLKVVKNHSWNENWGDKETGDDYTFNVVEACDVTVTFDPATETVNVTGDGVTQDTELDVYSVIAAGNGEETYLNDVNWDPCDPANAMTEVADGIWEMTMEDIYAFDNYNIKFAVNSVDADGNPTSNPWAYNFGAEVEQLYPTGEELDAVYNGKSCIFEVEEDGSTVKFQLDLRNFDFKTKQGAKMTITVSDDEPVQPTTEPAPVDHTYTVAGSSAAMFGTTWNARNTANDMIKGGDGVYWITYADVQPEDAIQLKVVEDHDWDHAWGDKETGDYYTFNVVEACDVTVTFDPATETVNVTGDGVTQDTELDVYSVIAVGNGEETYLNGADWDPCDQSNALTQVSDGIWEMTMEDIYAFDYYNIKFVVNSVDADGNPTSNPWAYNFGAEVEQLYPTGEELTAVYNGKNCIFEVEEDESIVKFQLDLRNFDFDTKRGAKMTITVTAPEPEPTTVEPTTEEPTTVEPTTAEPTTAPHEYDGDGQRVYFRFPDESVWTHEGLKITARTGKANVYCCAYAIYGNSHKYSLGWQTRSTMCDAEAEGGAITDATLFSFDLASQQGGIEEGADYGIIFSTAAGQNQTCDLNLSTECIGDTVIVTPFNGQVDRKNAADSYKVDHYAAWQNHTDPYGPKATISSIGALMPGYFPANQPHQQQLSNALKHYLTNPVNNLYFQYDNNMVLCEALQVTPQQVYDQYLADNADIIAEGEASVGPEGETEDKVPCPFYRYMGENDQGKMVEKKLAVPSYVRDVLGLSDEPATTTEEPTTEEPTTAEPTEEPTVLNGPQADGYFYRDNQKVKAYELCEYQGNYYLVAENHKYVTNCTRNVQDAWVKDTGIAPGKYEFGADGAMIIKQGPNADGYFYRDNQKVMAYELCEYQGNYYLVAENNKYVTNCTRNVRADWVKDTGIAPGKYEFGADGAMIIKQGPNADGYFYRDNQKVMAYELCEYQGNYYLVAENHKYVTNCTRNVQDAWVKDTGIDPGKYEFGADGAMIIKQGPNADGYFYRDNQKVKAYELCEYQGNYYLVAENNKYVTNCTRDVRADWVKDTGIAPGKYEFGADGAMIIKQGPNADGYFYRDNQKVLAYELCEYQGNYYLVAENHKYVTNCTRNVQDAWVKDTGIAPGKYEFGADGAMIIKQGPNADGYFYRDNQMVKAYELCEYQGNYYLVAENNKYVTNCTRNVKDAWVKDTGIAPGRYSFGADGKMIILE